MYSDEDKIALKRLIENTTLFIQASGIDPSIISDWGRAKRIDSSWVVHFDRAEVVNRRVGGEMAAMANCFLRSSLPIEKMTFDLIRNYCKEDGSWEFYEMASFNGKSWHELYLHVLNAFENKFFFTRFKKWVKNKFFRQK